MMPSGEMTNDEYQHTQAMLQIAAWAVTGLDLNEFLERIGKAHAAGPILNPSLYREAGRNLENLERLARAAQALQREVARQQAEEARE